MAILSRSEVEALPQTRQVARCRTCDEDGLIWDKTSGGKPWLFGLMFADKSSKPEATLEVVQRVNSDGETARKDEEIVETRVLKVEVVRQAAHICPMAGPKAG